jgi:hypothetical protein
MSGALARAFEFGADCCCQELPRFTELVLFELKHSSVSSDPDREARLFKQPPVAIHENRPLYVIEGQKQITLVERK